MKLNYLPEIDIYHDEADDTNDTIIPRMKSIQSSDIRALALWMQVDSAVWFPPCE